MRSRPGAAIGEAPVMRFIYALARFAKPLVAAVEGPAVGLGTTLCFHCDLVYASPSARFHMPFVDLGLVPEAGSSLLAPLRFGRARASEYLLLGEPFDAEAARAGGLVNAVVDAASLHAHALAKAKALAAKPRQALLAARRLIRGDEAAVLARMDEEVKLFEAALKFARSAGRVHGVHEAVRRAKPRRPTLPSHCSAQVCDWPAFAGGSG